jgi:hypothetical protein
VRGHRVRAPGSKASGDSHRRRQPSQIVEPVPVRDGRGHRVLNLKFRNVDRRP